MSFDDFVEIVNMGHFDEQKLDIETLTEEEIELLSHAFMGYTCEGTFMIDNEEDIESDEKDGKTGMTLMGVATDADIVYCD